MKVLHIIQRYWPYIGGSERYFQEISERLVRDGHEVTLLTTDAWDLEYFWDRRKKRVETPLEVHNGVRIRRIPVRHLPASPVAYPVIRRLMASLSHWPVGSVPLLFAAARLMPWLPDLMPVLRSIKTPFDVVHAANVPFDSLLCTAFCYAQERRIPFFITPFTHLGEPGSRRVRKYYTMRHQIHIMRQSAAVFVQTELERDLLASKGVPREVMLKTGVGVNPEEVTGGNAERFRARHGISEPIVFYIGTAAHDKGTVHLVEAMRRLWKEGNSAKLVLAGPVMDHFKKYFDRLPGDVRDRCALLGFISEEEKRDLLAAGDVFVMPSRTDSFGIVYLEAWLCGKPVIGARAGGVPEVIRDRWDGFLVSFGDTAHLASRIAVLLEDRVLARGFGLRGKDKVLAGLTWDRVYAEIANAYKIRSLAGEHRDLTQERHSE